MAYRTNETIKAKSGGMLDTIRQNPVPAALAAIGIGWLVFKGRSSAEDEYEYEDRRRMYSDERLSGRRYPLETRYYSEGSSRYGAPYGDERGGMVDSAKDRVGGAVESARETVGGAVESARETVGGAVESARETVGGAVGSAGETVGGMAGEARDRATELRYEARHRARRTGGSMSQMLQDNPLGVGAIALALGAAVGLAVPETEQEHRLLGEYRDDLLSRAGDVASQTMDKVQRVAGEVAATATETARQEAKTQGLTPQQMMSGSSGASSPPAGSSGQGSFGRPTTSGQRMSGGEDHPRTPGASGTPRE